MNNSRTLLAVLIFSLTLISDLAHLFHPESVTGTFSSATLLPSALPLSPFATVTLADNTKQSVQPTLAEQLSNKILRLHIIADSDSEEAQAVKLLVRDAVCEYLSPLPEGIDTKETVCAYLNEHLSELIAVANGVLQENGCTYRASACIERRFFPLKTYGAYCFPPGEYDALCITLGSGQGQNWWCLAFPSLCLIDGSYAVTNDDSGQQLKILLTDEEYEAILIQEPKVRFRFRLLEWLKGKYK